MKQYKYLSNVIDASLTMNDDFKYKCKKVTRYLNMMSKIRPFLNKSSAEKIYTMMIIPLVTYGCQLHAYTNRTKSGKLAAISTKASHIINNPEIKLKRGCTLKISFLCASASTCHEHLKQEHFNRLTESEIGV